MLRVNSVRRAHADHLGTPQMLTDGTGAVVWDASYRPFGEATVTGAVAFNLRFPGQYFDAETGLHYNMMRDYDAGLGRYLESDPIGLSGGWNTYAYAGGNPVSWADPTGLQVSLWDYITTTVECNAVLTIFAANFLELISYKVRGIDWPSDNTDKYYHCNANCQAAKISFTAEVCATVISDLREDLDSKAPQWDKDEDQVANRFGRKIGREIRMYGENAESSSGDDACNDCPNCEDACGKRYGMH